MRVSDILYACVRYTVRVCAIYFAAYNSQIGQSVLLVTKSCLHHRQSASGVPTNTKAAVVGVGIGGGCAGGLYRLYFAFGQKSI